MEQHSGRRSRGKASAAAGFLVVALGAWLLAASIALSSSPPAQAGDVRGVNIRIAFPTDAGWDAVDVQMLLLVEPDDSFDELAEAARAAALERFPGGVEVKPQVTGQFEKLGWSWPDNTTSWVYNPANKPDYLQDDAAVIRTAAETWNFAGGADFHFTGGDLTTAPASMCNGGRDGQNTVAWAELTGSMLAMTCIAAGEPVDEFAIEFDAGRQWTTSSASVDIDLQSVALHEFGHALGLYHSNDPDAVMHASYIRGTLKRALHQDDIDGLIAIYGLHNPEPTPTPATTPAPTPGFHSLVPALRRD